jgi:hypothetical protein
MPRVCLTRSRPSSGFLAPSTVCTPSGLADTLGPLPLMGFTLRKSFRTAGPSSPCGADCTLSSMVLYNLEF